MQLFLNASKIAGTVLNKILYQMISNFRKSLLFVKNNDDNFRSLYFTLDPIAPIHTFVNIPALIRKRSVFLSSRAGIFTKV